MQSTRYTTPHPCRFRLPRQLREPRTPISRKPGLIATSSLRTPLHSDPEEDKLREEKGFGPTSLPAAGKLPVVIRKSGRVSRYVWDGGCLRLVSVDGGAASFGLDFDGGVRELGRACRVFVRDFFIPKRVSATYLDYVKWKLLHRVFSSALQVLATQAMFRAIGIGYSRSLPSAAALNWVLKDGLGRLSRCIYTASLASAFDTNLKRVRFSTSVIFSLSIGVELLTPVFPQYFLLLASIANIAKQISLACYLATGSAVHRSFAVADNLGEVSAKAQIQSVCFDNLGLMLAALLNMSFKNNQRLLAALPFVVYPIFAALDLLGIYQGLKYVHLQTLTKDRLEIILNTWTEFGYVPSPAEVSKREGIDIFNTKNFWPIRIGSLGTKVQIPKLSLLAIKSVNSKDYYFICLETFGGSARTAEQNILLCLREGAGTSDVIMGLLQACYIRKALIQNKNRWERILGASDVSDSGFKEWFRLAEDSKQSAERSVRTVSDQIATMGWAAKNILLSTREQARYSFIDD
ncbi:protein root UVB sensitive 4 isoform X2 [Syzygium oleosum]|uniref:protein root UVB sensitive 4 isoform X2 n=1 Tax=Syzygium oleosum TaxID=219896 RepID=UPI0024B9753A|nr:protein root UVB sensitive 4 isoform X2 [Syzygium oleosum]